jgi:hypothetical protein
VLWWVFDKYLLRRTDFGISENPLQIWWLWLHAAAATVMVWLFGYLGAVHIQRNWQGPARRNSGLLFASILSLLTLSGYLIYYVDDDRSAALITQVHWLVGLCAPLGFLLHWGLGRRRAHSTPPVPAAATPPVAAAPISASPGLMD